MMMIIIIHTQLYNITIIITLHQFMPHHKKVWTDDRLHHSNNIYK